MIQVRDHFTSTVPVYQWRAHDDGANADLRSDTDTIFGFCANRQLSARDKAVSFSKTFVDPAAFGWNRQYAGTSDEDQCLLGLLEYAKEIANQALFLA
jgi:hypothetical protein